MLARSQNAEAVVRSLRRHLAAILAAPADTTGCFRLGAIVRDDDVVLIDPLLLQAQPIVERRYQRSSVELVDSPFVAINRDGRLEMEPAERNDLMPVESDRGHIGIDQATGPVTGLVWRAAPESTEPTPGQIAHAFASVSMADSIEDRLDAAITASQHVPVRLARPDEKGSLLRAVVQS